jgi:hypothetical protein
MAQKQKEEEKEEEEGGCVQMLVGASPCLKLVWQLLRDSVKHQGYCHQVRLA